MESIKLEYIFIEKEKYSQKSLRTIIEEIIDGVVLCRDTDTIIIQSNDRDAYIFYELVQNRDSNRVYLKLESVKLSLNNAISQLSIIDDALSKSAQQRYYYYIKEYDGVSASYADRLYPKYAKYERLLRKLILNIVTEAYGDSWDKETIPKEMRDKIKEIAKGNVTLNTILENTTLDMLEDYLFKEREMDYKQMLEEKFWGSDYVQMSKEEICDYIQRMKPTSLWEKHFSEYGDQKEWEVQIKSVNDVRNKVAHHKSITGNEYEMTRKQLNKLIRNLNKVLEEIQNKHFTAFTMSDVLIHFSNIASKVSKIAAESVQEEIKEMQQNMSRIIEIINSSLYASGVNAVFK